MLNSAASFRRRLLAWYSRHGRDLPWRKTHDPYAILVSEVMLQQTQVATVIPYFHAWLHRFPDFRSLANASAADVLHAWQGLGYYARARNLHAAAKTVMAEGGGIFPASAEEMRLLSGLGRYTANAVATFAFAHSVPIVEANIARLLARLFDVQLPIDSAAGQREIWRIAAALLPKNAAREYNSALMDLGALICTARQPKCENCPVRQFCRATDPASLPRKRARHQTKLLTEHHALTFDRGRILLTQSHDRWSGMWILPRLLRAPKSTPVYTAEFPFTHHRITLAVYRRSFSPGSHTPPHRWFALDALDDIPLPSPHRRAVTHLIAREPQKLCSTFAPP